MANNSSASSTPLYTQQDVTKAAGIKYETLQVWMERGLVSSSYTLGDRPVFTENDKVRIVRFAEKRRDDRGLPPKSSK